MASADPVRESRTLHLPATLAALLLCALLAACGQKGDLYLPEPEPAVSQQDEGTVGAPAADEAEADEDDDGDGSGDDTDDEPPGRKPDRGTIR